MLTKIAITIVLVFSLKTILSTEEVEFNEELVDHSRTLEQNKKKYGYSPKLVKQIKQSSQKSTYTPTLNVPTKKTPTQEKKGPSERVFFEQGIEKAWISDLQASGIDRQTLEFFINKKSAPMAIHFWQEGEPHYLGNMQNPDGRGNGQGKILNLSDEQSVINIQNYRSEQAAARSRKTSSRAISSDSNNKKQEIRYKNLYRVREFNPGYRDDRKTRILPRKSLRKSLQGPDHAFKEEDIEELKSADEYFLDYKNRTISLGHHGEIILKVKGYLVDAPGPDFTVFENPFFFGGGYVYQEFAQVGVATKNEEGSYRWFSCNPALKDIINCAGVVPTVFFNRYEKGGDQFDLSLLGVDNIRYIKIRDTGLNQSNFGVNTEGFDLDALEILHFSNKKKKLLKKDKN